MKHFLLVYSFVPDHLDRRAQYHDAHLRLAWRPAEMAKGGRRSVRAN